MGKSPFVSKTLWFNGLALIVLVAAYYGFKEFEPDQNVPPLAAGIVAFVTIIAPLINILFRFLTPAKRVSLAAGVGGLPPLGSKTIWFNLLTLVVALAGAYGFGEFTPSPEVRPLAEGIVALLAVLLPWLLPVGNILLRFVTNQPIRLR